MAVSGSHPSAPVGGGDIASACPVIRFRAFLLALLIIPADQYWVLMMEKVREGPYPTTISLFANVIFFMTLLAGFNTLLKRVSPKLAFSAAEMLLVYSMLAISTALAGHDMMPTLVGQMTYAWQHATPENQWANTFLPHLPKSLSVTDPEIVRQLWEGNSSLYDPQIWRAWLMPSLKWCLMATALMFTMMCVNVLMRKSWTDYERLPFPIVQLPIAMTEPTGEMWKNRFFWIGVAFPAVISLMNGLHVYFPNIPLINVGYEGRDIAEGLTTKPWNALGWTPMTLYPFVIGLGFLLRTDLLFSCVFFYWFHKVQGVATSMFALDGIVGFPFSRQQAFGGYISIVVMMLYASRRYLKQVGLAIAGKPTELNDADEAMSYRSAALGVIAGLAFLAYFFVQIGMQPWLALVFLVIYLAISLAIARIRAELGPPVHDGQGGPDAHVPAAIGHNNMTNGDMVAMSYFYWFNRAYRSHPNPIGMEALKLGQVTRTSQRTWFWAIILAFAVGAMATFWAYLHQGYSLGFNVGVAQGGVYASGAVRMTEYWWQRLPEMAGPDWNSNLGIIAGFLFSGFLYYMHLHVLGWPFHPIGYVTTTGYAINLVWFPLLIAFVIKTLMLRFGGLEMYKKSVPFFLGLIIGDMVPGCLWSLIGIIFKVPYYNFWGQ